MKIISFLFLISLSYNLYAQKSFFVRIYDSTGKKIHKGRVFTVTDTSLLLVGKSTAINIPVRTIGSIRTKHSAGNNLLVGAIVGATSMAILGAATAEPDKALLGYSAGEGAVLGALAGLPIGAVIGGLTILLKNSKHYQIDGDLSKWKVFQLFAAGNNGQ